jgi:hypothetical protein
VTGQITAKPPIEIFIQQDSHSSRLQQFLPQFVEDGDHLLAPHAWKSFQKVSDRISALQVIEQALDRHARARENGCAPENLRIRLYDAWKLHTGTVACPRTPFKTALFQPQGVSWAYGQSLVRESTRVGYLVSDIFGDPQSITIRLHGDDLVIDIESGHPMRLKRAR